MKTRLLFLLIFMAPLLNVAEDIAPNPIKAKGIVPSGSLEIALKWERVVAITLSNLSPNAFFSASNSSV